MTTKKALKKYPLVKNGRDRDAGAFASLIKSTLTTHLPELNEQWPCNELPSEIVVDNCPESTSKAVLDACMLAGIRITYMPKGLPWNKGAVESHFEEVAIDARASVKASARRK